MTYELWLTDKEGRISKLCSGDHERCLKAMFEITKAFSFFTPIVVDGAHWKTMDAGMVFENGLQMQISSAKDAHR